METSLLNQGSENYSVLTEKINALKKKKNAIILGHFYQRPEVQEVSDFIGDSLALAQKAVNTSADIILMAGVHFMAETVKLLNPDKKVLIPCTDAGCSLADSYKAADLKKFIDENPGHTVISYVNTTILNENPEVNVDAKIRDAALRPVQRMLEISSKLGI